MGDRTLKSTGHNSRQLLSPYTPVKKILSCRVPLDWAKQIHALAEDKGVSDALIMQDAIASYLAIVGNQPIATHEQRIAALERKLARLAS